MQIVQGNKERYFDGAKYFGLDCTWLHELENIILGFAEICPSQGEI